MYIIAKTLIPDLVIEKNDFHIGYIKENQIIKFFNKQKI